jgi:hypothetical protein
MVPLLGNTKNNNLELLMGTKEFLDEYYSSISNHWWFCSKPDAIMKRSTKNVDKVELKIKV